MFTILIAEKDKMLTDVYRRYFARCGFATQTVSGGVDCLHCLREERPDLLILDDSLLWGGAEGVLELIRDHSTLGHVPVILTSSDTTCSSAPGVVVMQKPFMLRELLGAIQRLVPVGSPLGVARSG